MVLDNASPTMDSMNDGAPFSDRDSYSTDARALPDNILRAPDISAMITELPRPLRLLPKRWSSFSDEHIIASIMTDGLRIANVLLRPPTTPEWQAMAYHESKRLATISYAAPLGISGSLYRAWSTRATGQIPFYKPANFAPRDANFTWAGLTGANARLGLHMARSLMYVLVGTPITVLVIGSYAATVSAVGQLSDSRMQDIRLKIRDLGQEETARRMKGISIRAQDVSKARQGQGAMENAAQYDTSAMSDNPEQASPSAMSMSQQSMSETEQMQAFDMDDASPTAEMGSAGSGQSGGNAWDRLRRGGQSTNESTRQVKRGNAVPQTDAWAKRRAGNVTTPGRQQSGESFSFSSAESDGQLAKDEAQRDFDGRIERERQGRDFSEVDKRWK